jgi:hypothetical protein
MAPRLFQRRFAHIIAIGLFSVSTSGVSAAVRPPKLQYQITTLPNGLTVVLHEDHSTPIVHLQLVYHVGSKNEKPGRTGFAHLFEHLMFKGSKLVDRRPKQRLYDRGPDRILGNGAGAVSADDPVAGSRPDGDASD